MSTKEKEKEEVWTVENSEALYRVPLWGDSYFYVNAEGHLSVRPILGDPIGIDIFKVVQDLRQQRIEFPLLIRFQDLLRSRVVELNTAFRRAIEEAGYENAYISVYPIKVNQLHEVVQEILEAGRAFGFGLECGSKAELVAALPHLEDDQTLLICNGYKDATMIRLLLIGQQLGKNVIPILEKFSELRPLLLQAAEMGVKPTFGVRVKVSASGSGKWADSGGDASKFGITITELVKLIDEISASGYLDSFKLLHFHLGSQLLDIQNLKQAVKEIARVYATLRRRGLDIRYLNVGGGLGVNYEAGEVTAPHGINYTLQEYVNAVVYSVKEICDVEKVPHPLLVSESGRALTAHHSVLIVEAIAANGREIAEDTTIPESANHQLVVDLAKLLASVVDRTSRRKSVPFLLEVFHDAAEKRQEAMLLFELGYLTLDQKAAAERFYWSTCSAINRLLLQRRGSDTLPNDLMAMREQLNDQYLCDFSVFQSILDYWAIGQVFPIMPVHRLNEQPSRMATLVDLTCDSDGKVDRFVSPGGTKNALELHPLVEGEPYYLGFFLMGAYQDILGDIHNLFGRVTEAHVYADDDEPENYFIEKVIRGTTVQEILAVVQYFPNDLQRRMEQLIQQKVKEGRIRPKVGVHLLDQYIKTFQEYTYLGARETQETNNK
ncbi:MAG TPA: biosynthetic arginine decarboxylase [Terriglobia bacterium]|nr:biosynthetic arginine decarboxylase [Terriglobia bacterium]